MSNCLNCSTERRPAYRRGHCTSCYRWVVQRERAQGDYYPVRRRNFKRLQAEIALYELAWREEPFCKRECSSKRLEYVWHALSAECRSQIDVDLPVVLKKMSSKDRLLCYKIVLSVIENAPRDAPVLSTITPSVKGQYMQEWSARLYQAAEAERQIRRRETSTTNCTLSVAAKREFHER